MIERKFKTVIFGCGVWGKKVHDFLKSEYVDFFCDNNENLYGHLFEGHPIIRYEQLLSLRKSEDILIILGLNEYNAEEVALKLEEDGIFEYVYKDMLPGFYQQNHISVEKLLELSDKAKRQNACISYMKKRIQDKEQEIQYLKEHADIHTLKPATGKLREWQLTCVKRASDTIRFLKENCPVKCWITGGTLIGYLRHNGFVPWDDDMDFGIMRDDTEALYAFFDKYSAVIIPQDFSEIDKVANTYSDRYVLLIGADYVRVCRSIEGKTEIMLELFTFDYYKDNASIEEYSSFTSDAFLKKKESNNWFEWYKKCQELLDKSKIISTTPTDKILPGIDSFINRGLWNIEQFLSFDDIFPLHEVSFENSTFLCVNKPEKYICHEYPNWKNFPRRIEEASKLK